MSDWTIYVPHRDPSDSLGDVACNAFELGEEDRRVVSELVLQVAGQCRDAEELIRKLGATPPERRRVLLDRCRERAGLQTATEIEAEKRRRAAPTPAVRPSDPYSRDSRGLATQQCAAIAEGVVCTRVDRSAARRWACPAHRELGDFRQFEGGPRLVIGESGALIDLDERQVERARQAERERSLAARREAEAHERRADAEADRLTREAADQKARKELGVSGFPSKVDGDE